MMDYMDLKIKYTAEEMFEYEKTYMFKKYFSMYKGLPGIIIAGALAYFAVIAYQHGIQSIGKLPLIVFGVLLFALVLVAARVLFYRFTYKTRYNDEVLAKEKRIVLSINGKYPENLGDTPVYEEALDFIESKELFIVEVGDDKGRRALIVPKRCLNGQKDREFLRDCAARMIQNRKDNLKKK